ncbi:hypothetical protein [Amycolatopsis sp. CA-128772]|uniref:hypothetical protein n=1 Tax=Amycolatopsis sp. CA-128772 TaxID=2073159 RepID=UPI000CD1E66F|nr:hypothetical protein [Amycolatopsis sp. CA-128772]
MTYRAGVLVEGQAVGQAPGSANGLKLRGGAVWATNLDRGTVLRIPIRRDGRAGAWIAEQ